MFGLNFQQNYISDILYAITITHTILVTQPTSREHILFCGCEFCIKQKELAVVSLTNSEVSSHTLN